MPGGSDRDELATIVQQSRAICDTPGETAGVILATGYRRVSADPDTVERVANAMARTAGTIARYSDQGELFDLSGHPATLARAAIDAIGRGE